MGEIHPLLKSLSSHSVGEDGTRVAEKHWPWLGHFSATTVIIKPIYGQHTVTSVSLVSLS